MHRTVGKKQIQWAKKDSKCFHKVNPKGDSKHTQRSKTARCSLATMNAQKASTLELNLPCYFVTLFAIKLHFA